jgi:hypothetical protein
MKCAFDITMYTLGLVAAILFIVRLIRRSA